MRLPTAWMSGQRPRREGQPGHRRGPRHGDRRLGPGAVDRPRLRGGDVLQRRRRPGPARRARGHPAAPAPEGREAGTARLGHDRRLGLGHSRAVDYLVTDKDLDKDRIAVVGHSRLGKTALLAAAFDERIALAIPHQAGCGGTAPSRGKVGESVKPSTRTSRTGSTARSRSSTTSRTSCRSTSTAWRRWWRRGRCCSATRSKTPGPIRRASSRCCSRPTRCIACSRPADWRRNRCRKPAKLIDSMLGYYIRPGKHSMTRGDWKVFLDYADLRLGK